MDIDQVFPLKFCFNLDRQEERRRLAAEQFRIHHLNVLRLPAIDGAELRKQHPFSSTADRACAAGIRIALRLATRRGASAVLLFEDDVVLHDDFRDRVDELDLPEDWGLFYFGCQHVTRPVAVSPGVVRITTAFDTHAVGLRIPVFARIHSLLSAQKADSTSPLPPCDVRIAELHSIIPTYAAFPNLAWQRDCSSHRTGMRYSNYSQRGEQLLWPEAVCELRARGIK